MAKRKYRYLTDRDEALDALKSILYIHPVVPFQEDINAGILRSIDVLKNCKVYGRVLREDKNETRTSTD